MLKRQPIIEVSGRDVRPENQSGPRGCVQHPGGLGNGYKGAIAMQTIFDSAAPVKSDPAFGRGIDRRPFVPDLDDLAWAAQAFGDAEADRLLRGAGGASPVG